MTTAFWIVSLVIGIGLWAWLIVKAAGLVPFSAHNMRSRQELINQQLRAAEESKQRLEQVQAQIDADLARAREQQDEILRRARAEAVALADEISRRGRADADAQLERARRDIAVERDHALQEVRREAAELIVRTAGAAVTSALDDQAHQKLIDDALRSLDGGSKN